MSRSPLLGAVAAVGLASNGGRSQHALRQVIGRLEIVDVKETQQVRTVLAQASGKASIVGIGEAPDVAAWIVEDSQRVDLGTYWSACSRVPDMVRISADGRTLVIGCDAGLDVWRIAE